MNPKVSIILTCYNKPETVRKSIESVLNQTLKEWELFIMNDASNEHTTNIIKSYISDIRIHYFNSHINNENRHKTTRYATLINQAIPLSKGKYISYLTDDNEYLPERLEIMSNYLDDHPNVHIVYSKQIFRRLDESFSISSQTIRDTRGVLKKASNIVDHCSVMHTREAIERVKRKYNNYWDDHPDHWHNADAVAWERLNEFYPFHPIEKALDINNKTPYSFQILNRYLPDTIPEGTLIKGLSPDIYVIESKARRKISPQLFSQLKYNKQKIVNIPDPFLFKYPLGPPVDDKIFYNGKLPNNLLVKDRSHNIYFIQKNKKRLIRPMAMRRYNFRYNDIIVLDKKNLQRIPNGPPLESKITRNTILPDGILFTCTGKYYICENNSLSPIDYKYLNKLCFSTRESVQLSPWELNYFNKGRPISWSFLNKKKK
ncbi:glycosyltransferase family 2 protein [Alkalihalobacterium alkalinitrilicum]|uniref:glycosyltransferase family 2 protein n=1 Tax=Alkalihalobacterium alkalinitrilicum TaxID=427920 RepID=UPI0009951036|nr:glycosyltransferase family 2 protein [Alkalihalobacterium alkalinitrilicum]